MDALGYDFCMRLAELTPGDRSPIIVNTVIEIPKGSSNKYEVDKETGLVRLDRVLYSPLFYPCDYGYIPGTLYSDGDPIDVLVLLSHPTFPGCIVESRPIGVLCMTDEKGRDDKILCVAARDPRFETIKILADIGEHFQKEIVHFFEVYKALEEKEVDVVGWASIEVAHTAIQEFTLRH